MYSIKKWNNYLCESYQSSGKKSYTYSDNLITFLKSIEKFSDIPYKVGKDRQTIGYGTTFYIINGKEVPVSSKDKPITREQGEELLKNFLNTRVVPSLNNYLKVSLTQNQFDALCSMMYQMGNKGFLNSAIFTEINKNPNSPKIKNLFLSNQYATVGGEVSNGVLERRKKEYELYSSPEGINYEKEQTIAALKEAKNKLNEISDTRLKSIRLEKYLAGKKSGQLEEIFKGKDRILIDYYNAENDTDDKLISYINILKKQGWTVDLNEPFGYAHKIVESERDGKVYKTKRTMKIGPLISKISPEAAEFWTKNNKFYTTEQNKLYFASQYKIIISRVPIDILRMSDHDNWSSCHSTDGSYFRCAIQESVEGGAVAYIVNSKYLEGINLDSKEIFQDLDRGIKGIQPVSRIRIRRFEGLGPYEGYELGIPEQRIYGQEFPAFYLVLKNFLTDAQKDTIQDIKDRVGSGKLNLDYWQLFGGTYQDNSGRSLFDYFFDDIMTSGSPNGADPSFFTAEIEEEMREIVSVINTGYHNIDLFAEIVDYGDDISVDFSAIISCELDINPEKLNLPYLDRMDILDTLVKEYEFLSDEGDFTIIKINNTRTKFRFELDASNYENNIFGLRGFADELRGLNNKSNEIAETLEHILISYGHIGSDFTYIKDKLEEYNIDVNYEKDKIKLDFYRYSDIALDTNNYVSNIMRMAPRGSESTYYFNFQSEINNVAYNLNMNFDNKENPVVSKINKSFMQNYKKEFEPEEQLSLFQNTKITKKAPPPPPKSSPTELGIKLVIRGTPRYSGNIEKNSRSVFDISVYMTCPTVNGSLSNPMARNVLVKYAKYVFNNTSQITNLLKIYYTHILDEAYNSVIEQIKRKEANRI